MKKHFYTAINFIILGFAMMSGMRLCEWVFIEPPTRLLICISDSEIDIGECDYFEDYVDKAMSEK